MSYNYYVVRYGKLKLVVVVLVVVESSSVVVPGPMRSVPAGLCQDTCCHRHEDRE